MERSHINSANSSLVNEALNDSGITNEEELLLEQVFFRQESTKGNQPVSQSSLGNIVPKAEGKQIPVIPIATPCIPFVAQQLENESPLLLFLRMCHIVGVPKKGQTARIIARVAPGIDIQTMPFTSSTSAGFCFEQQVPFHPTEELLKHLQHNTVVIEVWTNCKIIGYKFFLSPSLIS